MERTKTNIPAPVGKPKWKKIGGGSLRIGKQIIKPNQVFEAYPEEIVSSFRKYVVPVSGDANFKPTAVKAKEEASIPAVKPSYTLQPHGKSLFLFDVLDAQGKVINDKSLKKDVAEKLIEDLLK